MNRKKQIKATRGRGGVVRLRNGSRIVTRSTRPFQERGVQENKRNIFFHEPTNNNLPVKEPSRNGRYKGRMVEVPAMMMYVPVPMPVVPQRQFDQCQVAPVLPVPRCSVLPTIQHHSLHFGPQSLPIVGLLSSQLVVGSQEHTCPGNNTNDKWPEDLEQLVAEWDYLPQGHVWEVIKWLSTPAETPTETPVPLMVLNIQEMMAEWDEEYDKKVQEILKWLGFCQIYTNKIESPKVVVEMESASIQVCSQWSSMVEQKESRQP